MRLETKRFIIGVLGFLFLLSLILVQYLEVQRKKVEAGEEAHIVVPKSSEGCVKCHTENNPAIVDHWKGSTHARKGVGCVECHQADKGDADAFNHEGWLIATVVTPRDCARCHKQESEEFQSSHHAHGGKILHSLDNLLAEQVEGARMFFNPHSPTPGMDVKQVNGKAFVFSGCQQCHGSKVALQGKDKDGKPLMITYEDLRPDPNTGKPTNAEAMALIVKDDKGRPRYHYDTWPNTGIGRLNLDGSLGSCSACHSRHDFSPRRARQPENCGKCHLGPDHPQKEIYEESKHGVAYRDLKDFMNLNKPKWVLGKDYSQAPTCATCHMSGHSRNNGKVTHNPGQRISWTNRPPISLVLDTYVQTGPDEKTKKLIENEKDETKQKWLQDFYGTQKVVKIITETDPTKRAEMLKSGDSASNKREQMKQVCSHCHTPDYLDAFYKQYDDFVILYNEKFAKPGQSIIKALRDQKLITPAEFDEEIEWTWYYLWHHEGRRARHGVSMMAPDYSHWHGTYEVADRFYMKLIPQAREIVHRAEMEGKKEQAEAVRKVIDAILQRPEHAWFEEQTRPKGGATEKGGPKIGP